MQPADVPPADAAPAPSPAPAPTVGEPLRFGAYLAVRELGRGATSVVYQAEKKFERLQLHDVTPEGEFPALLLDEARPAPLLAAVKVITFNDESTKLSRRFRKLFAAEAWVSTQLEHPNITKVYDWKIEPERAYLIMDLLEGHTLDEHISMDKLLPVQKVIDIMHKVAVALDYAHRRGVVNRDIKPANIMLCDNGEVKVMDFGLALNTKKNMNMDSTYINGLGSPAYMSPEQIKGYTLNHQTDLYSLGVMFYQLLTGRLPFRAKNPASLIYKIINTEAVAVNHIRPELPAFVHEIISKAMAKDLYSRYRQGAQLARDLSDAPYQRVKIDPTNNLDVRWKALRTMPVLGRLDDIDVWELLRASTWRELRPATRIMREGSEGSSFGFVVEGHIELQNGDRSVMIAARGDIIGAAEWLESELMSERISSATTLDRVIYLEVSPSAFKYATEELSEEIHRIAIDAVVGRLRSMTRLASALGPLAVHPAPQTAADRAGAAASAIAEAGETDASASTQGWGAFSPVEADAVPKPAAASAVVAHPMPAAAAVAITRAAFNRPEPPAQFHLNSSATTEFSDVPLPSASDADIEGAQTQAAMASSALATIEMAPHFGETSAFLTSEMAPNFMSTAAADADAGMDSAGTSALAPNFASTTAFDFHLDLAGAQGGDASAVPAAADQQPQPGVPSQAALRPKSAEPPMPAVPQQKKK